MAALEAVLKRDRLIVAAALATVTALAWIYVFRLAGAMAPFGASMPDMPGMTMPVTGAWAPGELTLTFAMWAVMMVGMMTPSAAPMILIYARVARQAAGQGRPLAATGWFAGGYLLGWMAFSGVATALQALVARAVGLTPAIAVASATVGGGILVAAGLYQWTALKDSCLSRCRAPFAFIQEHGGFKQGAAASLRLGARHGLYCIGCCWALMALLFVGGVMNVAWIAAISIFVLAEKAIPGGRVLARLAGAGFLVAGLWLLLQTR